MLSSLDEIAKRKDAPEDEGAHYAELQAAFAEVLAERRQELNEWTNLKLNQNEMLNSK